MRLIDADAFAGFIRKAINDNEYKKLQLDECLTAADVLEAVVDELEGKGLENCPTIENPEKCHNCNDDFAECDQFVCSECGIELQDWLRVKHDEDNGEISYHEYSFKFCPNCGRKVEG